MDGQPGEAVPGAGAAPAAAAAPVEETVVEAKAEAAPAQEVVVFDNSGLRATPAARAYARENGIDLSQVKGTGAKGRVHKEDVVDYKLNAKAKMSPLAARIAEVEGINTDGIVGTGPKGKIMKADVLSVLNGSASEAAASTEVAAPASAKSAKAPNENQWGVVETVPMSPMRKVISKRMSESYFSAPTFVVNVEVDMTELLAFT